MTLGTRFLHIKFPAPEEQDINEVIFFFLYICRNVASPSAVPRCFLNPTQYICPSGGGGVTNEYLLYFSFNKTIIGITFFIFIILFLEGGGMFCYNLEFRKVGRVYM